MPITGDALKRIQSEGTTVMAPPESAPTPKGETPGQTAGNSLWESGVNVSNAFASGLWDSLARNTAAGKAMSMGEHPLFAMNRIMLPTDMANLLSPNAMFQPGFKEGLKDVDRRTGMVKERVTLQGRPKSEGVTKVLEGAANAVGGSVTSPGGSIIAKGPVESLKNFMIASGAGAGGEVGADILDGLSRWGARLITNDEDTIKTSGEVGKGVGSVAGGIAGGYVGGAVKANAIGEITKAPFKLGKDALEALSAARKAKAAGDERALFSIMSDNFGTLRAETAGAIERYVMERFVDTARKSPVAQPLYAQAKEAMAKTGHNIDDMTLAQVTGDPVIAEQTRAIMPKSPQQAELKVRRQAGTEAAIGETYKRVMGDTFKPDAKRLDESLEGLRKETLSKVAFLDDGIRKEVDKLPTPLDMQNQQTGQVVRGELEGIRQQYLGRSQENYAKAIETDKGFNTAYDLEGPLTKTKVMLDEFKTKIDPASMPESLRKLGGLMEEAKAGKRTIGLKDIDDALQTLNADIKAAKNPLGDQTKFRNLLGVKEELRSVVDKQAPPEVKQLYGEAQRFHGEEYGGRFKEGVGAEMKKQSGAVPGRDKVEDAQVMERFFPTGGKNSEARMQEADKLFGGDPALGLKRNNTFYDNLQSGIMERFKGEVAGKVAGISDPKAANAALQEELFNFSQKYASQIERVPEVGAKLQTIAQRMTTLQYDKQRQLEGFRELVGSPFTKELGPDQANAFFAKAMSDKRLMERAVERFGPDTMLKEVFMRGDPRVGLDLEPSKLFTILNAGARGTDGPSAVQALFQKKFGAEEGLKHFEQLQATGRLLERVKIGDPRLVDPGTPFGEGYLQNKIGQSMTSLLNTAYQGGAGRIGPVTAGGTIIGRFLNAKVRGAIEEAQFNMLFDPAKARAFYKILDQPPGTPIEKELMAKFFGKSTKEMDGFMKRLFDTERVGEIAARSAAIGAQQSDRDTKERK